MRHRSPATKGLHTTLRERAQAEVARGTWPRVNRRQDTSPRHGDPGPQVNECRFQPPRRQRWPPVAASLFSPCLAQHLAGASFFSGPCAYVSRQPIRCVPRSASLPSTGSAVSTPSQQPTLVSCTCTFHPLKWLLLHPYYYASARHSSSIPVSLSHALHHSPPLSPREVAAISSSNWYRQISQPWGRHSILA